KQEIEKHQTELREFRRIHEKFEGRLEQAKKEHAKVSRDVGKIDRAIKRREADIKEKETSLVPIDEKIHMASEKIKKVATRLKEIKRDQANQNSTAEQIKKDIAIVDKAYAKWEEEQKALAAKSGRALSDA